MNIETEYRESVLKIWNEYKNIDFLSNPQFSYRKYPLLPKSIDENSVLFVGINPSFNENNVPANEKPIYFYDKLNEDKKDIQYFEKIKEVAKYCNNTKWSHLDMLFIRETKQKNIEELCKKEIEFINQQLNISFAIIEIVRPKIIIVINSFASEFFGKMKQKHSKFEKIWQGYDLFFEKDNIRKKDSTFDPVIGTYRIDIAGVQTPIIFSSMLSGQRALDLGSLERLKWQIKFIIENKSIS